MSVCASFVVAVVVAIHGQSEGSYVHLTEKFLADLVKQAKDENTANYEMLGLDVSDGEGLGQQDLQALIQSRSDEQLNFETVGLFDTGGAWDLGDKKEIKELAGTIYDSEPGTCKAVLATGMWFLLYKNLGKTMTLFNSHGSAVRSDPTNTASAMLRGHAICMSSKAEVVQYVVDRLEGFDPPTMEVLSFKFGTVPVEFVIPHQGGGAARRGNRIRKSRNRSAGRARIA
jgi:hypothetical protein